MRDIVTGDFACRGWQWWWPQKIRVVDWNIERGLQLPAILDFLAAQKPDLLTLQEVDLNARRTRCRNVAEEIGRTLGLDYVFGTEFEELAEGSKNSPAYTGQATLCRWPLENPRVIRFHAQSTFWHPRWYVPNMPLFQERLGGRIALATEMRVAGRSLVVYNLHLESRGPDQLRMSQLEEVLRDATTRVPPQVPVLLAGDLNLDPTKSGPSDVLQHAGFSDAVRVKGAATTPRRSLLTPGRSIDCGFVRGSVRGCAGRVENAVRASDHYPLTFSLDFS